MSLKSKIYNLVNSFSICIPNFPLLKSPLGHLGGSVIEHKGRMVSEVEGMAHAKTKGMKMPC